VIQHAFVQLCDRALCWMTHVAAAPRVSWEALRECQALLHQSPTGYARVLHDQPQTFPAQGDADAKTPQGIVTLMKNRSRTLST